MTKMRDIGIIQEDIGATLLSLELPDRWTAIEYWFGEVTPIIEESDIAVIRPEMTPIHQASPDSLTLLLAELRDVMYVPSAGTWYVAELRLERATRSLEITFDYDHEPNWTLIRPRLEAYEDDQRRYPRPLELLPRWHPLSSKNES